MAPEGKIGRDAAGVGAQRRHHAAPQVAVRGAGIAVTTAAGGDPVAYLAAAAILVAIGGGALGLGRRSRAGPGAGLGAGPERRPEAEAEA